MEKYRKKPVVVEAALFQAGMEDGIHFAENLPEGLRNTLRGFDVGDPHDTEIYPYIKTLEGNVYVSPGDYIVTGIKGERYPCKPDIFEKTYETVSGIETTA